MARLLARSLLVPALVVGLVVVGGPAPASVAAECPQGGNIADVAIAQTTSGATNGTDLWVASYAIEVTNLGPCPVPTLTVHDDLPASASSWAIVAANPSSWVAGCSPASGAAPTPPTAFDCTFNANLGVPGSGSITLQVTWTSAPTDTTNAVEITAPLDDPPTCDPAVRFCDTKPDNNRSWAGYLFSGGQINDGSFGTPQFRQIRAGQAVSAEVTHQTTTCPNALPCFDGQVISINVVQNGTPYFSTSSPLTFVFFYSQEAYHKKPSQITIVHVLNGTAYQLENCKGHALPDQGCVSERRQVKIDGVTYSVLTVTTPQNDDWFGY